MAFPSDMMLYGAAKYCGLIQKLCTDFLLEVFLALMTKEHIKM